MELGIRAVKPREFEAEALVIGCYENSDKGKGIVEEIDKSLSGLISRLKEKGEIKCKSGEITVIHTTGQIAPERVVMAGLGKVEEFKPDVIRQVVASACRTLAKKGVSDVSVCFTPDILDGGSNELLSQLVAEGAILGSWSFKKYVTGEKNGNGVKQLTVLVASEDEVSAMQEGIHKGEALAQAANLARDMINEPGNFMRPEDMVAVAREVARTHNLEINVMEESQMQELGMEAVLAVGRGSSNPPRFMILRYQGRQSEEIDLALVGKAVTFDSGGISIKPSSNMETMKMDMAGGASVIGAISAIAALKPAINVVVLVAAVENLPGSKAQRPGDVVKSMSGKTIEVISTDAEGRMTLADVVTYAGKLGARRIVDVATLTGACIIALGEVTTAVFGNNQEFCNMVVSAGDEAGEYMWQMPMYPEYKEQYKSDVADMKNVGGRDAGAITAAMFVGEFAGDNPWVHLDIAGTAMISKDRKYWTKGGTGIPVRTLTNLALKLAETIK